MTEHELAQALLTSGPAGAGIVVLALFLKQWLTALKSDVLRVQEKVEELEKTVQNGLVVAASHHAQVAAKLEELDRRITILEGDS